jgi:hypothetical protein
VADTARIRAWIHATLTADPALAGLIGERCYHGNAPAAAQHPFVVFQMLSPGNDLLALGARRIWADPLYLIKAVTKGDSSVQIEPIADRIDALLHAKSGQVTNGIIWECVRERPHEQPELTNGVRYMNLGGEYRIKASSA